MAWRRNASSSSVSAKCTASGVPCPSAVATTRSSSGRETVYAECGLRPVATVSGSAFISASSQTFSKARSATSG
jgi:hypothetical protein